MFDFLKKVLSKWLIYSIRNNIYSFAIFLKFPFHESYLYIIIISLNWPQLDRDGDWTLIIHVHVSIIVIMHEIMILLPIIIVSCIMYLKDHLSRSLIELVIINQKLVVFCCNWLVVAIMQPLFHTVLYMCFIYYLYL